MQTPPKVQGVESSSVEAFLKAVLQSGLLNQQQLQGLRDAAPPDARSDAKAFSEHLIKAGKLSRFQAAKLLDGVWLGLVLGPFHVLAPIGKGGMGSVYLARDSRTEGLVAVKVLPPKRARA